MEFRRVLFRSRWQGAGLRRPLQARRQSHLHHPGAGPAGVAAGRDRGEVMFKAMLLKESDGKVAAELTELEDSALPEGEVTVAVEYSTRNYKDGRSEEGRVGKECVSKLR